MGEFKIHNIHPYHGKFYAGIPRYFIEKYGKNAESACDPFCGSGTTLAECAVAGIPCVGVDNNFLSCKIARAKTALPSAENLYKYAAAVMGCTDTSDIGFKDAEYWFTPSNYAELCAIYNGLRDIPDPDCKNALEVALSATLKTVCNKRKTWNNGYIADNVLPDLPCTVSLRKTFENKVAYYAAACAEYAPLCRAQTSVVRSDILAYSSPNKFDLIITSPPYPFAVDFVRYNRLSYYLFGQDLDAATEEETGARNKRNRKGCVEKFFDEMREMFLHIVELTAPKGHICMTVGDTHRNKQKIEFVAWLVRLFADAGLELREDTVRELRKQSMPQKRIPTEHMLVFYKDRL